MLNIDKKFDKIKYINDWKSQHKKRFATDLDIDLCEDLEKLLKDNGISKAEFVRRSYYLFKNDKDVFTKFMK